MLLICAAAFTAFVIWGEVSDSLNPDTAASAVLALGCQGLAVVLVLWANIMQIIKGHSMSVALKRYEDWVSSLSTKKIQVPPPNSVLLLVLGEFFVQPAAFSLLDRSHPSHRIRLWGSRLRMALRLRLRLHQYPHFGHLSVGLFHAPRGNQAVHFDRG